MSEKEAARNEELTPEQRSLYKAVWAASAEVDVVSQDGRREGRGRYILSSTIARYCNKTTEEVESLLRQASERPGSALIQRSAPGTKGCVVVTQSAFKLRIKQGVFSSPTSFSLPVQEEEPPLPDQNEDSETPTLTLVEEVRAENAAALAALEQKLSALTLKVLRMEKRLG